MEPWKANRRKLLALLEEKGVEALILANPSNITYATGLRDPSGALVLSSKCGDHLLVPLLDYHRAEKASDIEVHAFYRGSEEGIKADLPKSRVILGGLVDAIAKVLSDCKGKIGADLSATGYQLAKSLGEKLSPVDLAPDVSRIRSIKSEAEIRLVVEAVGIAEKAFSRALQMLEEGVSEAQIAGLMEAEMRREGAWGPAFQTIVAFYSNTAYPHHSPGWDKLSVPGPVLIDWGAIYNGYRSDTTRTMWWGGKTSSQFMKHLEAVVEAANTALDLVAPGVQAWEVDSAARRVLAREGLDKYFIHGLGHGVGVDIHEEPYIRPASKTILEPGMIITIEPGIYLPGLYGIRVENTVLVTKTGYRVLNTLPSQIPL